MEERRIQGAGGGAEHKNAFSVWAPIAISFLALIVSASTFTIQDRALGQQREQIAAQSDQLETQKDQLATQSDALELQKKEFRAAEDRWRGEGPLFSARGYVRQDPERALKLLQFSPGSTEAQMSQELEHVYMSEAQANLGPAFIEAELTNVGRSMGLISHVSGELWGRFEPSSVRPTPGIRKCIIALGDNASTSPSFCKNIFAEEDVICPKPDGTEAICQFPLQVPQQTSIRLRLKLNQFFQEQLMCEGDLRGRVEVAIHPASGSDLKTAFLASNWRGCPGGSGVFSVPSRVPFK